VKLQASDHLSPLIPAKIDTQTTSLLEQIKTQGWLTSFFFGIIRIINCLLFGRYIVAPFVFIKFDKQPHNKHHSSATKSFTPIADIVENNNKSYTNCK